MSNFYLKSFLTLTPQKYLKQYFEKEKYSIDFDWEAKYSIDNLHDAILQSSDRKKIVFDFRIIHNWANDTGINNLIDLARSPLHGNLEIGEKLGELENDYASSMYVWVKHSEVFFWATEMTRWEHRKGKKHHYVGTGLECDGTNEEVRNKLGTAIAEYFKKQRKGSRCDVDYYMQQNPTRHFFFANPEDNIKGYRSYNDKDKIVREAYQPIFQVVFEYNTENGDLAIHAKGKNANAAMHAAFCTKVLEFKEPPNADTEVFDLKVLRDGKFKFPEVADIPLESVTLRMAMIELNKGANRRVTLEASPYNNDNRQVEAMMLRSYLAHGVTAADVTIRKVKIEIKFKPVNMQKMRPITFIVGAPQYSELSNDEKSEKAMKYLREWGLLVKHDQTKESSNVAS